jgi:hypothetical protein
MSGYEGSAMQEADERAKAARERRVEQTMRENPSLTWAEARTWVALEEAEAAKARAARCCRCQSCTRAEVVSVGGVLGRCKCACHGAMPR